MQILDILTKNYWIVIGVIGFLTVLMTIFFIAKYREKRGKDSTDGGANPVEEDNSKKEKNTLVLDEVKGRRLEYIKEPQGRQWLHDGQLVYHMKRDREGNLSVVEPSLFTKDTITPDKLYRATHAPGLQIFRMDTSNLHMIALVGLYILIGGLGFLLVILVGNLTQVSQQAAQAVGGVATTALAFAVPVAVKGTRVLKSKRTAIKARKNGASGNHSGVSGTNGKGQASTDDFWGKMFSGYGGSPSAINMLGNTSRDLQTAFKRSNTKNRQEVVCIVLFARHCMEFHDEGHLAMLQLYLEGIDSVGAGVMERLLSGVIGGREGAKPNRGRNLFSFMHQKEKDKDTPDLNV